VYTTSKSPRKTRSPGPFLLIIFTFAVTLYSFYMLETGIKPIVMTMAEYRAKAMAVSAMNTAVKEKLSDDIQYRDLIFIKTDSEGNITMLQANTVEMNKLASSTVLSAIDKLWDVSSETVKVPLGAVFNSQIFAHYGPKLNIKISPVGTVLVDFRTEFEEAGINQTRHRIYLTVRANMKVVIPFAINETEVITDIPIAETIIVGKVPDTYIKVPESQMLNVLPKGNNK
jgi:sporulation protein YunB